MRCLHFRGFFWTQKDGQTPFTLVKYVLSVDYLYYISYSNLLFTFWQYLFSSFKGGVYIYFSVFRITIRVDPYLRCLHLFLWCYTLYYLFFFSFFLLILVFTPSLPLVFTPMPIRCKHYWLSVFTPFFYGVYTSVFTLFIFSGADEGYFSILSFYMNPYTTG